MIEKYQHRNGRKAQIMEMSFVAKSMHIWFNTSLQFFSPNSPEDSLPAVKACLSVQISV